jgi:hypothetical protein
MDLNETTEMYNNSSSYFVIDRSHLVSYGRGKLVNGGKRGGEYVEAL